MTPAQKNRLMQAVGHIVANRHAEAVPTLEGLLAEVPFNPYVNYNLGLCYWNLRRQQEAIRLWRTAIGADPSFVPAMVNLGQALQSIGDMRESLRYTQMAARRKPNDPMILANLATVLAALGEARDALDAAEHGLSVDPDHYLCLSARMGCLNDLNRADEAAATARRILTLPERSNAVEALTLAISHAARRSDWAELEALTPRLHAAAWQTTSELNPMAMAFCFDEPGLMVKLAKQRRNPAMPARPARQNASGKIRIGYLSPDFREHPVAHMLLDVLRHHDRTRFDIVTIGILPPDNSELNKAIIALADEHIDLTKLDDSASARLLRERQIDVLVDLVGGTKWCRPGLLQRRPCPAQIMWLGCPSTTGALFYDAFLVDEHVAPPGYEQFCTEPLVRLPCCYHPISRGSGTPNPALTRSKVGLPEDAIIIGMLQQPNKLRPPLVDLVARTLASHSQAHLWIRVHQDHWDDVATRFAALGLPRDRLHFAVMFPQRDNYLAALTIPDLLIDSFPYGGHSTTGEALIQGTPILTIRGASIHARVASSMLTELGLVSDICEDMPDMARRLDEFLASASQRAAMKARFSEAARHYAAHGPKRLSQALESAYQAILTNRVIPSTPAEPL